MKVTSGPRVLQQALRSPPSTVELCWHLNFFSATHLGSLGVLRSIIISTHAQHILHAVVELREAIELTVAVVNCRLVDAIEGGLGVIGAV